MGALGSVVGTAVAVWCYGFVFIVIAMPLLEATRLLVDAPRFRSAAVWGVFVFAGAASWWLNGAFDAARVGRALAGG